MASKVTTGFTARDNPGVNICVLLLTALMMSILILLKVPPYSP